MLWTRVTPSADAVPGSGLGAATTIKWEVALDAGFRDVVKQGEAVASADRDHTVHVDPWDLAADTVYFYRFAVVDGEFAGHVSPTGRTRTAPDFDASPEQLNLAVASCANWESGFFSAYTDIANRAQAGDLDLLVFLGDYIYEYGTGEAAGPHGPFRIHEPAWETVTLQDYRMRHGRYRTDPELQAAHTALPWVVVWDDHETADNSWRGGAQNHSPAEGDWLTRRNAALRAYFEWLPVRATSPSEEGHIYRSLRFGDLVELTMMDLRTYRDQQARWAVGAIGDEGRTMMGSEQFEWLRRKIETSSAHWNVMGSSVMVAPLNLITLQQNEQTSSVADFLGSHASGVPLNPDQWDGYTADRVRLLDVLEAHGSNVLFLSGDIHTEWANSLWHGGREIGVELVCSSVSAPNVDEQLGLPADNAVSHLAEQLVRDANPHVRHVDLDSHGYSIARVRRDEVQMHWLRVDDVEVQGAAVREAVGLVWRAGGGPPSKLPVTDRLQGLNQQ
ncbi:phosphodiesterase/alkaline phosphatase D [Corynebacterium halotolerans YIM 70093 = DSM 44683]|uniref:Phosphodiesterase/alkaline phosphatase D n=1 Tax=Corynebacterium halotolerans YIM 70093 = DSM 44683 TaxID=1121362 RepID=M1P8R5_9CORY|nr:phosphodiesterase/alkaline phosphatase D [Corynebacterium halotolerans YIM 70093 = DSM 44683]